MSFALAYKIRHGVGLIHNEPKESAHPVRKLSFNIGGILFPLVAIILTGFDRLRRNSGVSALVNPNRYYDCCFVIFLLGHTYFRSASVSGVVV